jgi:hypothetical protein
LADILEAIGRSADIERIIANAREDEQARAFFQMPSLANAGQTAQ